jgi:hypothetical protein
MSVMVSLITSQLSPLGFDWWILLGGFVPALTAVAIAFIIWLKRGKED